MQERQRARRAVQIANAPVPKGGFLGPATAYDPLSGARIEFHSTIRSHSLAHAYALISRGRKRLSRVFNDTFRLGDTTTRSSSAPSILSSVVHPQRRVFVKSILFRSLSFAAQTLTPLAIVGVQFGYGSCQAI